MAWGVWRQLAVERGRGVRRRWPSRLPLVRRRDRFAQGHARRCAWRGEGVWCTPERNLAVVPRGRGVFDTVPALRAAASAQPRARAPCARGYAGRFQEALLRLATPCMAGALASEGKKREEHLHAQPRRPSKSPRGRAWRTRGARPTCRRIPASAWPAAWLHGSGAEPPLHGSGAEPPLLAVLANGDRPHRGMIKHVGMKGDVVPK